MIMALTVLLLAGCSKKKSQEPERTEPWLANPTEAGPSLRARYVIESRCSANVELKAKEATPRGSFRVCRGELDLDLGDLSKSHGSLAVDVGSIEMQSEGDGGRSDEYSQEAQNWLDVGANRPEAERERLRWATFTLTGVDELSVEAAHAGKPVRAEAKGDVPVATDSDAGKAERRMVALRASGTLLLHDVRVDVSVPLRVVFEYAGRAAADRAPERVLLESRHPVGVSLEAHNIAPRDNAGVLLAQGVKLLGSKVGREARVDVSVSGTLAR